MEALAQDTRRKSTIRRSVRGATPYRELLELLNKLEYRSVGADSPEFTPAQVDMLAGPLTADSEQRILSWCARYGLLGILQHRLLQVVLSPRNDAQVEYRRISLGWAAVERARENPFTPILEPHAVVQPLRGVGLTAEPLSETWARFFPAVPRRLGTRLRIPNRSPIRSGRCMPSRSKIFSRVLVR